MNYTASYHLYQLENACDLMTTLIQSAEDVPVSEETDKLQS